MILMIQPCDCESRNPAAYSRSILPRPEEALRRIRGEASRNPAAYSRSILPRGTLAALAGSTSFKRRNPAAYSRSILPVVTLWGSMGMSKEGVAIPPPTPGRFSQLPPVKEV